MITRFAPSPTGYLHLGHAYSALLVWQNAEAAGGRFVLRMEDIDRGRCRPEFEAAITADLAWLGLSWPEPVRRQSEHFADYRKALDRLQALGVLYPCFCTRREIRTEIENSPRAPHGPGGALYPGTCRRLTVPERTQRLDAGQSYALRLDTEKAVALTHHPLFWHEHEKGQIRVEPEQLGDVVVARKDTPASYHLAVTVDDAIQKISHIIRGADLFHATHIHRLLQELLGLPVPQYHHHPLINDQSGERLAKRRNGLTVRDLRAQGVTAADIGRHLFEGAPLTTRP